MIHSPGDGHLGRVLTRAAVSMGVQVSVVGQSPMGTCPAVAQLGHTAGMSVAF